MAGPVVGGCQSCRTCQKCQTCKPAPTAPCQYCTLESKKVKEDKTRFQVEQKEVCVPAVRLPWMKCNPPKRSRVRTVNVLKKEKYKGETCEYKWSVHEPEDFDNSPEPTPASGGSGSKSSDDSVLENTSGGSGSRVLETYPDPSSETSGLLELSDPAEALGDIPRPPLEN